MDDLIICERCNYDLFMVDLDGLMTCNHCGELAHTPSAIPATAHNTAEPVAWLDEELMQAYTNEELADVDGTEFKPLYMHPPHSLDAETRALAISICEHVLSHTHPWAFIDEAKKLKKLLGAE